MGQARNNVRLRSHVDPILYSRFLLVTESDIPPSIVTGLKSAMDRDAVLRAYESVIERDAASAFHEAYHCFQGALAPFLKRFAISAWIAFIDVFDALSRNGIEHREWQAEIPQLQMFSRRVPHDESHDYDFRLSPLHIVEGVTSLIEWQMFAKSQSIRHSDLLAFKRWLKRNPAYPEVFGTVAAELGPEVSLSCAAAIGCASLFTSNPVKAFRLLVNRTRAKLRHRHLLRRFNAMSLPESSLFVKSCLDEIDYELPADTRGLALDDPRLYRLAFPFDPPGLIHPLQVHDHIENEPRLSSLPENAAFLWLSNPETLNDAKDFFHRRSISSITILKIRFNDGSFQTHAVSHPAFARMVGGDGSREAARQALLHVNIVFSVGRRATGTFFDPLLRTCEQRACPEWAHNYCNRYFPVPNHYHDCHFVDNLKFFGGRKK